MVTPVVEDLRVIPVAGRDSMLLNLSGAHGPFFTRNLLLLRDSAGRTGVGEVPGGERIRETLERSRDGAKSETNLHSPRERWQRTWRLDSLHAPVRLGGFRCFHFE